MTEQRDASIASLSLECQTHFEELGRTLETKDGGKFQNELANTAVDDELGRFRIWASNIGALNIGRASLDYRLRDAEYLRQNVTSLLEGLNKSMSEG
jgi:hypothetical protein